MFANVTREERERMLAKLRWLRFRVHLSAMYESSPDWYRAYCATDRLDPAPGVQFGTAGWEYMRWLAQVGEFSQADEQTASAMARLYLGVCA